MLTAWYHHNHTPTGMWTSSQVRYKVLATERALDLAKGLLDSWYGNRLPFEIELADDESTWMGRPC